MTNPINKYSLEYAYDVDKLKVLYEGKEKGELISGDFKLKDRFIESHLNSPSSPINSKTSQNIKCLKIKEKKLHFAEHHPIANAALSVISSIAIIPLSVLWALGALASSFSGGGPHSPIEAYMKSTQRGWNWIKPIFIKDHLKTSINTDKSKLLEIIDKINKKFDDTYVKELNAQHKLAIQNYGEVGWQSDRASQKAYNEMLQIKTIAKDVLNRDLELE